MNKVLVLVGAWLCAASCPMLGGERDAKEQRTSVPLEAFHELEVQGNISLLEIRLAPGQPPALEGAECDLEELEVSVKGGKLSIIQQAEWKRNGVFSLSRMETRQLGKLVLRASSLEQVAAHGQVKVQCPDMVRGDAFAYDGSGQCSGRFTVDVAGRLVLHASGQSKAWVEGRCGNARMEASGQSKIDAAGVACREADISASGQSHVNVMASNHLLADVSGQSRIDASGAVCEKADVSTSGQSRIRVSVSDELRASTSGASRVTYAGNPSACNFHSSSASRLEKE